MCISSYILILSLLSLFSQGFLLSRSLQEAEDEDMLLAALNLGKILQSGDKSMSRGAIPLLKHYKTEDSSVFNDKNAGNMKVLVSSVLNFGLIVKLKLIYTYLENKYNNLKQKPGKYIKISV